MDHKVTFFCPSTPIFQRFIHKFFPAGVEAQTLTVWRQADKYRIPRIVYVNKMDRLDSSFDMCMKSLNSKFEPEFLPLQVPIRG